MPMRFDIVSLFPEFVAQLAAHGVVGRAGERGLLSIHGWNPRDHAEGNYRRVDDRPFGGGPGMVMLIDPLRATLRAAREADPAPAKVIYLSPQGQRLTQAKVRELAAAPRLVLLCGRYEGVDERLLQAEVDEEISIGDFVVTGGEIPAMALTDCVCRMIPGVLSDEECYTGESHWDGLLEYPQYTRPETWEGRSVPPILLSGHHANVAKWRRKQAIIRTRQRRPDMYEKLEFTTKAEKKLLAEIEQELAESQTDAKGDTET